MKKDVFATGELERRLDQLERAMAQRQADPAGAAIADLPQGLRDSSPEEAHRDA